MLAAGVEEVRHAQRTNEIPFALVGADRGDRAGWLAETRAAIDSLLVARRAAPA
jgi:hypothetical protein